MLPKERPGTPRNKEKCVCCATQSAPISASILIGEEWVDVANGSFIRIPAGITHDFENRTDARIGLLNFFIPGGFEEKMPAIVDWFERNR